MKKVLVLLAAFTFILISCKKEEPPAMPPAESMVMDFKAFGGGNEKSEMLKSMLADTVSDSTTFLYAKSNVDFWNFMVFVTLFVPVSSWYAAIGKNEWTQLDDNTWQWKFDYSAAFSTYHARLIANTENADTKWEMYISNTGFLGFPEVKWYEGTMSKDGSKGHWTLNENPTNPTKFLQVDWEKSGSRVSSIRYTYVKELDNLGNANPYYNNYIEYGETSNTLDRYYNISLYDAWWTKKVNAVNIEWNSTDYHGHVKSPIKYLDSEWRCWNNLFETITCE